MPSVNGSTMNMLCVIDYTSAIEQLCSCGFLGRVNTAAESGCQSCIWVINCVNRSCLSRHTVRELSAVCCRFNVGLHVDVSCVSSEGSIPPELLSSVFKMLHFPPKYKSCCRLMKIWWMNSQLDLILVVLDSDNTFSFMDVASFTNTDSIRL